MGHRFLEEACKGHMETVPPPLCKLSAVCKEALSCCMADTSRPTGLPTGLGFWWLEGRKKLVEGPKLPPG